MPCGNEERDLKFKKENISLYARPNVEFYILEKRRMRWAGHVARMGEERGFIGSWWGNRM